MIVLNKKFKFDDIFGDLITVKVKEFHVDLEARKKAIARNDLTNGCGYLELSYLMNTHELFLHLPIQLSKDSVAEQEALSGYIDLPYIGLILVSRLLTYEEIVSPNELSLSVAEDSLPFRENAEVH